MPVAGAIFDLMDGKVARWRNESSMLGQELDSLADLVGLPASLHVHSLNFCNSRRSHSASHPHSSHSRSDYGAPATYSF